MTIDIIAFVLIKTVIFKNALLYWQVHSVLEIQYRAEYEFCSRSNRMSVYLGAISVSWTLPKTVRPTLPKYPVYSLEKKNHCGANIFTYLYPYPKIKVLQSIVTHTSLSYPHICSSCLVFWYTIWTGRIVYRLPATKSICESNNNNALFATLPEMSEVE